jgi:arabinogalactan endo-1,4-beta-galactosidase
MPKLTLSSDSWADPQKQPIPAAWPTTLDPLADTLKTYVKDTLIAFMHAGVNLDMVALGNKIRHGMLWPVGQVNVDVEPWSALVSNFSNLATLYKAARKGVDQAESHGARGKET